MCNENIDLLGAVSRITSHEDPAVQQLADMLAAQWSDLPEAYRIRKLDSDQVAALAAEPETSSLIAIPRERLGDFESIELQRLQDDFACSIAFVADEAHPDYRDLLVGI